MVAVASVVGCEGSVSNVTLGTRSDAAQNLGFQPRLGVGVSFAETKTFRRCVTVPVTEKRHAFAHRLYDELAVKDRHDLNQALNIDASVGAKGIWGAVEARGGHFQNVKMTRDAFYWLVNADYRLLDEAIDTGDPGFGLTPEAKKILNGPGGLKAFYEACGQQFYSGMTRGAHYALLYEFKSEDTKTIDRIKALAAYSGWGLEAKGNFESLTNLAVRGSVLKIHSTSAGGGERLASYATHPAALEHELEVLREDLYRNEKGVEVEWFVSDYEMFPEIHEARASASLDKNPETLLADKLLKDNALRVLYSRYVHNVDLQQQVNRKIEASRGPEPLYTFSPEKQLALHTLMAQLESNNTAIAQRAKECIGQDHPKYCCTGDLIGAVSKEIDERMRATTPDQDFSNLQDWTLYFAQHPHVPLTLQLEGKSNAGHGELTTFESADLLIDSPEGVRAGSATGPIIGIPDRIRDPVSGLLRPYICVYNYADRCSLRIVRLPWSRRNGEHGVKLQLTVYDDYGFVDSRLDFPMQH